MDKTPTTMELTDEEIVEGLRRRDTAVTRDYFYDVCRIAYNIYNRHYGLDYKVGLDFYSLAHEYYLALDRHDFRQLEDRKPTMTLRTWMVNGFRFILLDRLKAYRKEHRMQSLEERLASGSVAGRQLSFDVPDDQFSEDVRRTVREICTSVLGRDTRAALILRMMLIDGFKGKEVAQQLGISPSAVTQQFHKLMNNVVTPYFQRYYEAPVVEISCNASLATMEDGMADMDICYSKPVQPFFGDIFTSERNRPDMKQDHSRRITPAHITELQPGEIFVFGSNLAGMHGGGAARAAHLHFGAVLGNGDGPQGQSYAIPTMQGGPETIRPYVDKFIAYAKAHPEQTFLVTPIGCGIAGFTPADIAPLFRRAVDVDNIHLPQSFWRLLE